jgi:hypothetical protein
MLHSTPKFPHLVLLTFHKLILGLIQALRLHMTTTLNASYTCFPCVQPPGDQAGGVVPSGSAQSQATLWNDEDKSQVADTQGGSWVSKILKSAGV